MFFSFLFFFNKPSDVSAKEQHRSVCANGKKDEAGCHLRVIVDAGGNPKAAPLPQGYGPFQFRGAYNLSGVASSSATIAVVDAYGDNNILSDLNTYSTMFGIPKMNSCSVVSGTIANPCFQKVDQNGGVNYPGNNSGWALETALDVEVAHAICQNCNILLVQARSNQYSDLMAGVDRARIMGAKVISNSYGSNEFSSENVFDSHFNYPGVSIVFSSGDNGYGTSYPAASPYVVSVGGTTLNIDTNNKYVSESVWSGTGSGCSLYEGKPVWQTDSLCLNRTIADVSADADPNTGAAVYDSVRYSGRSGWFKVGGTSLATPIIAASYALAGKYGNALPYNNYSANNFHDVSSGNNGNCGGMYLCTALPGFDGPTGLGTPNGIGGF